jgi:hypothetical protein
MSAITSDSPEQPRRAWTISAKPADLTIEATNSALLVIDMQNDFGSEGGMFHRAGIDISAIQRRPF